MRLIPTFFLFCSFFLIAQSKYPQDYFSSPLEIPLVLSGTFAELRSSHFHSGLDIKTKQRSGLKVKASANGFVSRIKLSHFGYGKALYIKHPNGYTSVYAHLEKFSPEIEAFVKKKQYEKESYEIELFPKAQELQIDKNSLIAYSGNSGGSGGPHLHFEIRDKAQRPINPMLFGINIKDTRAPLVRSIWAYPLDEKSFVNTQNSKQKLNLIPLKNGDYVVKNIDAIGNIGFGIETIDKQDLAANSNGVYNIQTFANGKQNFELDFKSFAFNETKHVNGLIDYEHFATEKERIQKLFNKNNPLSIIKPIVNKGVLAIKDMTNFIYKIRVSDYKNNESWVTISINGTKHTAANPVAKETTPHFVKADQNVNLQEDRFTVNFYKNTFYDNFFINFKVSSDTLKLHKNVVFAKKKFNITYNASKYKKEDRNKLYIARLIGDKNYLTYTYTKRKGDLLIANTKKLGTYTIAMDTISPSVSCGNFKDGQWLSKYRYLKIKISDEESGISNYRANVNGQWILMEYDYKTKTLTHDFNDGAITDIKNNFKVIVTDNVGNNSTFEAVFYRK